MTHRWSGWPGAWCLDCGCEDITEIALCEINLDPDDPSWLEEVKKKYPGHPSLESCKEPLSNRWNPYKK